MFWLPCASIHWSIEDILGQSRGYRFFFGQFVYWDITFVNVKNIAAYCEIDRKNVKQGLNRFADVYKPITRTFVSLFPCPL